MQKKCNKKLLSLILSAMLIVAMAFVATGCNGNIAKDPLTGTEVDDTTEKDSDSEVTVLGKGDKAFEFSVVDEKGKEKRFEIHTDKTTVGDALLELGLIEGDAGDFGLYVKTVDDITVDYDTDGKYWAFYINGEYAMTGVDATPITKGEKYTFKVE